MAKEDMDDLRADGFDPVKLIAESVWPLAKQAEKPLHVRVAEALGVIQADQCDEWITGITFHGQYPDGWIATSNEDEQCQHGMDTIVRYDTDWSATGPLIERYKITLRSPHEPEYAGETFWEAFTWPPSIDGYMAGDASDEVAAGGKSPLLAVCNLILALAEAGKLEKVA